METGNDQPLRNLVAASAQADVHFQEALRALENADPQLLASLLRSHPQLARQRGTNGNSLLNLAVSFAAKANPGVGSALVTTVLAAEPDVNAPNIHGWTPLHQAAYCNLPTIAATLIEKGANVELEARGAGGTPLIVALFWGHRETAELLSRHSLAPGNLRVAAGLGNETLVEKCFRAETTLAPEAFAGRGFYRPHSGFPEWTPVDDTQQVLDEALVWAAKSGRTEVLPRLMRGGAQLSADPYRGTPLIWAAVCNRLDTANWLLDHGAKIDQQATFGGPTHGQGVTALIMAAQSGHLEMVRLLVERGADRKIKDDLYHGDAEGAANYFGKSEVRDYLRFLPA